MKGKNFSSLYQIGKATIVEETMAPSENFTLLADYSPDIIIRFNLLCEIKYANASLENLLAVEKKDLLGHTVDVLGLTKPLCKLINNSIRKVLKTGEKNRIQIKTTDKYLDCYLLPEKDSLGTIQYVLAIARDITEMKRAELALVASEKKFRTLAEASPDIIMKFDRSYRHLYVNSRVKCLTGIDPEAFIGKSHHDLGFPNELIQLWEQAIEKVFVSGKNGRAEFILPDGQYIDWLLVPEFSDDGTNVVEAVITTARDISEIRKAEIALRISEKNLCSITDASPDLVVKLDAQKRHLYVNAAVEKYSGRPATDFIGRTPKELNFNAVSVGKWDDLLDRVIATRKTERKVIKLLSGETLDWYLVPEFGDDNKLIAIVATARDITSLKVVEEELRQSNHKLEDAMKIANICTYELDLIEKKVILNPGLCEFLQLKPEKGLTTGDFLRKYVHPDDVQKITHAYHLAATNVDKEFLYFVEYRILRGKKTVHVLASVRSIKDRNGTVVKLYGTSQDITDMRSNEEELEVYKLNLQKLVESRTKQLRRSEARLSDALKLASLGTWEFDFNTQLFKVGDEVLNMLGSDVAVEGTNTFSFERFHRLIHPDHWAKFMLKNEKILNNRNPDFLDYSEYKVLRPDGEVRNLHISIKILVGPDGRHTKHYGTIQDITEIRKMEAEKDRMKAIVEATSDIIGIIDKDGNIIYLNQAGRNFYGLEKVKPGKWHIDKISKRGSKKIVGKESLKKAIRHGIWNGENIISGKTQLKVPVSQVVISHNNASGTTEYFSTIMRDISKQKLTEQDLIYKNNELDTFVYRASHDLRGPIASLLGLHNIVQYEIKDPAALEFFTMYNIQIKRLNDTILSLIEITKIKDIEATKTDINFSEIIDGSINSFANLPLFNLIEFNIDINVKATFVSDRSLLTTIIQNLVENAIKYADNKEKPYVNIEIKNKGPQNDLYIVVSDNGIGIPASLHSKIFDMFFRGTEQAIGSGLGLYILKNAVQKLKGKIMLQSEQKKGTTFEIILPVLFT